MFEKRKDLLKFLVVAETGTILTASDKLAMTQPALSRTISKLEDQFKGRLFERIPTGVRLTTFGSLVADRSRRILREIDLAEKEINLAVTGQTGSLRVTAGPMWMKAVLPLAIARFHKSYPGIELKLNTATYPEGVWSLMNGENDIHCGGIDTYEPLPQLVMREHILNMTWGIVAHKDHPLHSVESTYDDLADYPWIDYDKVIQSQAGTIRPSLTDNVLDKLYKRTSKRVGTVIRTNSVDLSLIRTGPYLSVLSLNFMERLPGSFLKPLPLQLGCYHYRAGILSRRSLVNMPPYRRFIKVVRDVVLDVLAEKSGQPGTADSH